jgi:hypothetical protein
MSFQSFQQNFPQTALSQPETGHLTKDGRLLHTTVWNRTGGGSGIPTVVKTALTAAGSGQGDALSLTADWNDVETSSGNGVVMPPMKPGNDITVRNDGPNSLNVYPFPGAQINNLGVNAPFVLTPNMQMEFRVWTTTLIRST